MAASRSDGFLSSEPAAPREAAAVEPRAGAGKDRAESIAAVRQVVGLVLGQLGAVTAFAIYFGWAQANAYLGYFGLNTSMVNLTTTDYVLRSVGAAYWPLMWLGIFVAAGLTLHPYLQRALAARPKTRGRWLLGAVLVAVAMLAVAIAGLRQVWIFPRSVPVIPLLITGGFALITYSAVLHSHEGEGRKSLLTRAQFVALSGLIAGGVFWAWGSYAATQGEMAARNVEDQLAFRTDVSVFSAQRLGLSGPGIEVDEVGDESSLYRFRYTGLRMLLRSDDRYFLLPAEWQHGRDSVFVLLESQDLRLQFIAPPDP